MWSWSKDEKTRGMSTVVGMHEMRSAMTLSVVDVRATWRPTRLPEECTVDVAKCATPEGILAAMTGPGLAGGVVGFDANHWVRVRRGGMLYTPCSG